MRIIHKSAYFAALVSMSAMASAGTINSWDLTNVQLVPTPGAPETGVSKVYDRDVTGGVAGATTHGQVIWATTPSPGMTVLNNDLNLNPGQSIPDCIIAVGGNCEGPFQSEKRVKIQALSAGPIDLVFNATADSETNSYRVYQRLINLSATPLKGFKAELGYGIGSSFVLSGANDGLSFDPAIIPGPDNVSAFTQFPFGLFGDAASNPNSDLNGFFSTDRAGFALNIGSDQLTTGSMSTNYAALFGAAMLNQGSLPMGYYYDNDGNPSTDPLLMAWSPDGGTTWEERRIIDLNDPTKVLPIQAVDVTESSLIAAGYSKLLMEDLRNINVNFNILVDPTYQGGQFTLRYVTAAVPEPGTWLSMIVGFGLLGGAVRRRRALGIA